MKQPMIVLFVTVLLSIAAGCSTIDAYREESVGLDDLENGKLDEALVSFNRALSISPNEYLILSSRAYAYELKGMFAEAVTDLETAIPLVPIQFAATAAWYNRRAGWILQHDLHDYGKALAHYEQAKAIYEKDERLRLDHDDLALHLLDVQLDINRLHRDQAASQLASGVRLRGQPLK